MHQKSWEEYSSVQRLIKWHFPDFRIPQVLIRFALTKKRTPFSYVSPGAKTVGTPTEDTILEWALLDANPKIRSAAESLRDKVWAARRYIRQQRRWRYLSTLICACSTWTRALTSQARAQSRLEAATWTTRPETPIPTRDPTLAGNEDPKTAGGTSIRHPTSPTHPDDSSKVLADEEPKAD